ncbi:enhancer of rudimentary [Aphis craccivora]|uniref:Enhancer of rudimentary n=1 Tax=Aphis craccivora TaxID=307492 RepID=A0A6G0Z4G8_APHCR|nr:enhancer of rudimentary [Aphis craccivora]
MQTHLDLLASWYTEWGLKLNQTKSLHSIFTLCLIEFPQLFLNNQPLHYSQNVKYLGPWTNSRPPHMGSSYTLQTPHVILFLQSEIGLETRTYSVYDSVIECVEGVCKIYKAHLMKLNPNQILNFLCISIILYLQRALIHYVSKKYQDICLIQQKLDKRKDI